MSETLTYSRMQILGRPIRQPGSCIVCGAVDRPVLDLSIHVKWYGAVYFCTDCITEAGKAVGLVSAESLEKARTQASQTFEETLKTRGLVAIDNGLYLSFVDSFDSLCESAVSCSDPVPVLAAKVIHEPPKRVSKSASDHGSTTGDKGPDVLSSSKSDGLDFDFS